MIIRSENTPPSSLYESDDDYSEVMDLDDYLQDEAIEETEDDGDIEIETVLDISSNTFTRHEDSILSCDIHPDGKIAVTGGCDNLVYVWDIQSGKVIMRCSEYKDSVIFAGFSSDGNYLGTADMSGVIKVLKCNITQEINQSTAQPWPVVFEYETDDINWAFWHFATKAFIVGTISGQIYMFKIPSGHMKVFQSNDESVECAKLFPDGTRLAAGYSSGSVRVWDLKTNTVIHHFQKHSSKIIAVDTHPNNNLLASISSEGNLVLATSNNGKIVGEHQTENNLEAVAFARDSNLGYLALGTLQGSVTIWDVSRQMIRYHCYKDEDRPMTGVSKILWNNDHLVTGCLDGSLQIYDGNSGRNLKSLTGHMYEILDFSYNPKVNIYITASQDGTAKVFKYEPNS